MPQAEKKPFVLTPEMKKKSIAHYRKQGASLTDLVASDEGALVPLPAPKSFLTSWRRWTIAEGFIAACPNCNTRGEFENVTKAGLKTIRFNHCGKSEKLPWLTRILYSI
jgi:hypothetical protein